MNGLLATVFLIVAAVAMVLLAVWILYLKFGSALNRSFALYLLVSAGGLVLFLLVQGAQGATKDWLLRVSTYFDLALLPILAYVAVAYVGWRSNRQLLASKVAVVAAGLVLLAFNAFDPCLRFCPTPEGLAVGPFNLLAKGHSVALGAVGLLVAVDWLRRGDTHSQGGALLLAMAFTANALFDGTLFLVNFLQGESLVGAAPGLWADLFTPWRALPLAFALPACAVFASGWRRGLLGDAQFAAVLALAGAALGTGAIVGAMPGAQAPATFLTGTWRIAVPLLAAYALVYHRLFGIEVQIRRALGRTVLACLLIGVLFGAQAAANAVWPGVGTWVALGVAIAMALAISPLDRLGQSIAIALMPHARPSAELGPEERTRLYGDRVATILADGRMALQDRVLLDRLREQLALPPEWAARIERDAWAQAARPRRGTFIEASGAGAQAIGRGRR